jgi:hypothetical protein
MNTQCTSSSSSKRMESKFKQPIHDVKVSLPAKYKHDYLFSILNDGKS